ncbi:MAG: H4MPT-linked C1 transfer pathway protein [Methanolinea sp.]|nr:H4MPT-linked C1 transfer pathway protein [Methanolinea sp.]
MIGIDVGGANVKVADREGVHSRYCPLWEGAPLGAVLETFRSPGETEAAVVMSGELADSFTDKAEGISWIVDTVRGVFSDATFYGSDGKFHDGAIPGLAAANWLASADLLRITHPDGLLVDMGSTTTDVIPLSRFSSLLGLTDLLRLQKGYLVYTGLLRTTLPAVIRSVELSGGTTPVSAEYFACSGDAHRVLGHISGQEYTSDTPDRKARDRSSCLRRLARVVCADLGEIGEEGAVEVARAFWKEQAGVIREAVFRAREESGAAEILTAGTGGPLLAKALPGDDLSLEIGDAASALPAYAVREVWLRRRGN